MPWKRKEYAARARAFLTFRVRLSYAVHPHPGHPSLLPMYSHGEWNGARFLRDYARMPPTRNNKTHTLHPSPGAYAATGSPDVV